MKKSNEKKNRRVTDAASLSVPAPTNEEIAAAAHSIWEQEGQPEGRAMDHWLMAEACLRQNPHRVAAH